MGLSWQQGPLSPGAIGRFLIPEPLSKRLLYAEPLCRRMRVRFGGTWIADSENVVLLFEPGRYPVAYFPETDVAPGTLERTEYATRHHELGLTSWYTVRAGEQKAPQGAWQHVDLPAYASEFHGRIAFAWPAMDAFYEEDERILGHAADSSGTSCTRLLNRSGVMVGFGCLGRLSSGRRNPSMLATTPRLALTCPPILPNIPRLKLVRMLARPSLPEYLNPDPQTPHPVGPMDLGRWKSQLKNVGCFVTQRILVRKF